MWQKVDPRGFRTGIVRGWVSEYFAPTKQKSVDYMVQDLKVRNFIDKFYKYCGISKVVFRKWEVADKIKNDILIFTAKPALVLGKEWSKIEEFKKQLKKKFGEDFDVIVKEISKPEQSAKIMAEYIASQLERRMPYRRVVKSTLEKIASKGAKWVKIQIGWRLNGAEMARKETFKEGRIPLQTLRADVDYYYTTAITKYGILGIKVWIYKGDINNDRKRSIKNSKTTRNQKRSSARKRVVKKAA